jgi:hypothetical protein
MTDLLSEYDLAIPPSLDVNPSEVELALATNAASLRAATLIALLAKLVVVDAPPSPATRRSSIRAKRSGLQGK